MNVLIGIDDKYVKYSLVMLYSLLVNNPDEDITIYIPRCASLSDSSIDYMRQQLQRPGFEIKAFDIPQPIEEALDRIPSLEWGKVALYRVFAYDILRDVDRILYLDSDIIINRPLREYYNLNLDGKLLGACKDLAVSKETEHLQAIGFEMGRTYVNSGVLLMDLAAMRERVDKEALLQVAIRLAKSLRFPDQDIINIYFSDEIKLLDGFYYNCQNGGYHYTMAEKIKQESYIIHLVGKRPWNTDYRWHMSSSLPGEIWWKYARELGFNYKQWYVRWRVCNWFRVSWWNTAYVLSRSSVIIREPSKDTKKTILHIWGNSVMESRGTGYMDNVLTFLGEANHWLYLVGDEEPVLGDLEGRTTVFREDSSWSEKQKKENLRKVLREVDQVVVHGIGIEKRACLRALDDYSQITTWVIWGHEVTDEYESAHSIQWKHPIRFITTQWYEYWKRKYIKGLDVIVGEEADCALAEARYPSKARIHFYNFAGYAPLTIPEFEKEESEYTRILVGHNAYPQCRHIESFRLIKQYDDGTLQIICPLPYTGDRPELVDEVSKEGEALFGDRFVPLYERLKYDEYCKLLSGIDIAVFNHNRQMAQGNIEKLLYYGKKLYLSRENTDYDQYTGMGAKLFLVEEASPENFVKELPADDKERNHAIMEEALRPTAFINTWKEIFIV